MFPQGLVHFFGTNQEALWFSTLLLDLGCTAKYLFKIIIAAIDTLFIYWARWMYRRDTIGVAGNG